MDRHGSVRGVTQLRALFPAPSAKTSGLPRAQVFQQRFDFREDHFSDVSHGGAAAFLRLAVGRRSGWFLPPARRASAPNREFCELSAARCVSVTRVCCNYWWRARQRWDKVTGAWDILRDRIGGDIYSEHSKSNREWITQRVQ